MLELYHLDLCVGYNLISAFHSYVNDPFSNLLYGQ